MGVGTLRRYHNAVQLDATSPELNPPLDPVQPDVAETGTPSLNPPLDPPQPDVAVADQEPQADTKPKKKKSE